MDQNELVIGYVYVTFDGVELGFTDEDGISYATEEDIVKFFGAQSNLLVRAHRAKKEVMISAKIFQLTLEKWNLIEGMVNAPVSGVLDAAWTSALPRKQLIVTMPGSNGSTRTLVATASAVSNGEMVFNNKEFTGNPVQFLLFGDTATGKLFTVTETAASVTVPAPASYQFFDAGITSPTTFADAATTIIPATGALQITFNTALRPDSLSLARIRLKTAAGNVFLTGTLRYGTTSGAVDMTKVQFLPAVALAASTAHDLIITQVISAEGVPSASTGAAVQFTTTA